MEYSSLLIILNIILIESLLSVDNAAVLATMVQPLPKEKRNKALHYGIIGAYIFRGLCLLFASWLIKILWLKIAGGIYLMWLTHKFFKKVESDDENFMTKGIKKFMTYISLGLFWTTVVRVELMDLAFSIDNIFAVVAFTDKFALICLGVAVGILAMRFVAQSFVKIMDKYPSLEKTTYIVIALLGFKLVLSGVCDYLPGNPISPVLNSHALDLSFSLGILIVFFIPIIFTRKSHGRTH